EFSSCDVACHVTLRLGVIHAMRDDTTVPSRGLGLRPIGKSSECFQLTAGVGTGKAQNECMFFRFAPKANLPPELRTPPAVYSDGTQPSRLARLLVSLRAGGGPWVLHEPSAIGEGDQIGWQTCRCRKDIPLDPIRLEFLHHLPQVRFKLLESF